MDAPAEFRDRYRAAVVGFAVGDALGFPLRGVPPAALGRLPSLAEDFAPRPRGRFGKGQFSDDTQLMLAVAESAVLQKRVDGRAAAAHFAGLWREGVVLQPPPALAGALERLAGGTPWMSAGAPIGVKDPSVLSRGLIAGLWDWEDPSRLSHDAGQLAVTTHKDPACAAATAAFARAVALGLTAPSLGPIAFCEALAAVARPHDPSFAEELRYLPRLLAWDLERALEQLRRIGVPPAELAEAEGLPAHLAPVLLCAVYVCLRVPHDFREALDRILRCGGEADVAAGLCGAILGARLGCDGIPARLRRNVLYADHLLGTADRLLTARFCAPAEVVVAAAGRRRTS